MIVYEPRDELIAWAQTQIEGSSFTERAHPIGYARGGKVIAVAVFDLFTGYDCEVSFAVSERRWFDADFALAASAYPFLQLGLERVSCQNPEWNRPARILTRALGFKWEGRKRRQNPKDDLNQFGMLRPECRFLKGLTHGW